MPGYGLSKCKWLGGSPSTLKRPGGGPVQGPNAARVMTGGGFIHLLVEKIDKMNRTKLPIRKRIGNIPQFPVGVDAAVDEVGTTNRLGFILPAKMKMVDQKKNVDKYYDYHQDKGHNPDKCFHLKRLIKKMIKAGELNVFIRDLRISWGRTKQEAENPKKDTVER
ncbi:hypothetical protein AgCh_016830 [Apium graveolens]